MISIVIPCFNSKEWIADAIESALAQTTRCEVIVVDDGSTDGSGLMADSYKTHGVKVIHQVNKGLASARNTGIMNSTGDYILFLDSDDILKENAAERLLEIAKTTDADVVAGSFQEFGLNQAVVTLKPFPSVEDFKKANHIGYCTLVKKSTLLEVGGYSPKMVKGYEDLHLWFDLLKRGKRFVTTQEVLWMYRIRENSMITDSVKYHELLMEQIRTDHKELW